MPRKNITKFAAFVIFTSVGVSQLGCGLSSSGGSANAIPESEQAKFEKPTVVGNLKSDEITESSGLAASKCQTDVIWTHNDSGDGPYIFAISEKGKDLGTWKVSGATNKDWEDISERREPDGKCYLYIGEIGNNELEREELAVYKVLEPTVNDQTKNSTRNEPLETEPAFVLRFKYPDSRQNAETLLVHPLTGEIYVLSKSQKVPSTVFKLQPEFNGPVQTASIIAKITVPAVPNGLITGGDISGDGKHVVICDYFAGYELTLPSHAAGFDEIWNQKPLRFDLGRREVGETVAYSTDGDQVFATSEDRNAPIYRVNRSK